MLSAVVVLYNPDDTILENIGSYLNWVNFIYIIDNSDKPNGHKFSDLGPKIQYVFNNGNLGIAQALNIGCKMALANGLEWIVTMDQDSKFLNFTDNVKDLLSSTTNKNIALYYPDYIIDGKLYDKSIKEENEPIIVMTSGNIINLKIHEKIGGFEEKLFIDYVDIEYCLKLKKEGYSIANLPNVVLQHELGDSKRTSFLFVKAIVTNHSSIRRYYITRNRLYVRNKYKDVSNTFAKIETRIFINDILKILMFESHKISKIKSIIKGYLDYRNNCFGIYNK
ncbi:glycosyltransferase family 2 protein [Flavobacterium circumlabens]|uniref:Glycosyltransferase family 2 protein n=1 Tax=Flavobacterium circumlabens TaxID=2133765 RepID=A0A4Y7UAD6_9FLAO|nr:glycosyltransferase family 2 protein [Flavobacterium circumlabens]TCN56372.1 rhamnosyltransferase [Flavobacterium circumlabens]TEB43407.1 glycosyltransferase family 2 protein [Flavobacterium circumlabens]